MYSITSISSFEFNYMIRELMPGTDPVSVKGPGNIHHQGGTGGKSGMGRHFFLVANHGMRNFLTSTHGTATFQKPFRHIRFNILRNVR